VVALVTSSSRKLIALERSTGSTLVGSARSIAIMVGGIPADLLRIVLTFS